MRIDFRQLDRSMRTALLVSACAALVAMTSGLLLTIHILSTDHPADHDSHDCTVCQQLLASSQKAFSTPAGELSLQAPDLHADVVEFVKHVERRHPEVSRPRGPPCSWLHPSV